MVQFWQSEKYHIIIIIIGSVASPICQEGQSEIRTVRSFAFSSRFFLFFPPIFPDVPPLFWHQVFFFFSRLSGVARGPLPPPIGYATDYYHFIIIIIFNFYLFIYLFIYFESFQVTNGEFEKLTLV